jgi:predicted TIM-barrel fold metal-dependent hydrolase
VDAGELVLVSVDDHVVEPPHLFDGRLPAKYQARAPVVQRRPDGTDVWVFEGVAIPQIGMNAVAGRPPEELGLDPHRFDDIRPGCYDPDERVRDMSADGVLGSVCFPSFPQFCGQVFAAARDRDLALAVVQAYNDWHIDEWCGSHPDRLVPLAITPLWSPDLIADEVRRVAAKGCHAISLSEQPSHVGLPSYHTDEWDVVWETCSDIGTIACLHIGSSAAVKAVRAPGDDLPRIRVVGPLTRTRTDEPIDVQITVDPITSIQAAADLLWSPALRRFPSMRFALSEGGVGWVPFFLERVDRAYRHHRHWTGQDFGDRLPSEVFREQVVLSFIDEAVGLENRHHLQVDNLCWESDFPHSDSSFPRSAEAVAASVKGLSDEEVAKITHENAMRHFGFDPYSRRAPEACTVRALRAEVGAATATATR